MSKLDNLRSKKQRLISNATEFLSTRGIKTPTLKAEYDAKLKEIDTVTADIEALEYIEAELGTRSGSPAPVTMPSIIATTSENENRAQKAKTEAVVRSFLKTGTIDREQRDLSTVSDTTGAALVAQMFNTAYVEAQKFSGSLAGRVNVIQREPGNPVKQPVVDITAQKFKLIGEGPSTSVVSTDASSPTLFSTVPAWLDTAALSQIYSTQFAEDMGADELVAYLTNTLAGPALKRFQENAIVNATDQFSNALPNSPSGGFLELLTSRVALTLSTGTLGTLPTIPQLNTLASSVDRDYYASGVFLAHPTVEAGYRGMLDSTGRSLFKVDPQTGFLRLVGDKLLVPSAAMPSWSATDPVASQTLIGFGDPRYAWTTQLSGVRLQSIGAENETTALGWNERVMVIHQRIAQAAALPAAMASIVTSAS